MASLISAGSFGNSVNSLSRFDDEVLSLFDLAMIAWVLECVDVEAAEEVPGYGWVRVQLLQIPGRGQIVEDADSVVVGSMEMCLVMDESRGS